MVYRYLELGFLWRDRNDRIDPNTDRSVEVEGSAYPNYNVVNYKWEQEPLPGYNCIIGAGCGVISGIFISLAYFPSKYKRLGYRDFQLLEKLCMPLVNSSLIGGFAGLCAGAVGEYNRIVKNLHSPTPYVENSKILD